VVLAIVHKNSDVCHEGSGLNRERRRDALSARVVRFSAWLAPNEAISSHVQIVRNEAIAGEKMLSLATRDFLGIMSDSPTHSGVAS
jgi:hypothetical protein